MPNNRRYLQLTSALEKRYRPTITRIIQKFRKEFISRYKRNPQAARNELANILLNEDIAKVLRSIYRTAGLMGAKLANDEIKKAATLKAAGFGRNETWIRDVINYLRLHNLEMVGAITETMREDIIAILEKAIENGWGIAETVKALQVERVVSRAEVIARTEINRAANVGHSVAAKSLPYEVDKRWVAAKDHRTRHSHKKINDHVTGEDDYFNVAIYKGDRNTGQFDKMLYPGDPTASAANTVNCRCRVIYIPKRDSQGRLLLRNRSQATVIPMKPPRQIPVEQIAAILKSNIHIGVEK